jgi:hypothetical protein
VEWTTPKPVPIPDGLGFRLIHRRDIKGLWLRLSTTRAKHQNTPPRFPNARWAQP